MFLNFHANIIPGETLLSVCILTGCREQYCCTNILTTRIWTSLQRGGI